MPTRLPHLYILTGASRGMGAAMAEQLLGADHELVCLSRHPDEGLAQRAASQGCRCHQWAMDLSEPLAAAERLQQWLDARQGPGCASATLINNAAALTRIGPIDACAATELSAALRVSLEAPMLLSAAFLRATRTWAVPKRVLNISSGLGRRAMAAQAGYCAAKAGLDHFTRALALDEARQTHGARVVSLAPGVIDTDMQAHLRAGDPATFPDRANFVGLKDRGELASPQQAAQSVLAYLQRSDFGHQPVADVRDA